MDSNFKIVLIFVITVTLVYVGFLGFLIIETSAGSIDESTAQTSETISSEASDLLWENTSEVTDPDTEEENGSSLTEFLDSESIESEEITDVHEPAPIETEEVADVPSDDFVYEFTEEDTYDSAYAKLPVFVDEENFFQYMETCYAERKTSIEVIFADDFYPHECPLYDRIDIADFTSTILNSDGTNRHVLYTLTLYPGTLRYPMRI